MWMRVYEKKEIRGGWGGREKEEGGKRVRDKDTDPCEVIDQDHFPL